MKVLLAVDGSEPSRAAVDAAVGRVWPEGTAARVLSVIEDVLPAAYAIGFEPTAGLETVTVEVERQARAEAERAAGLLRDRGVSAEVAVRKGDPRSLIVAEAEEWGADLIVVGSHGYRGLQRWLLGSVAQAVVAHAPCSVLVVRNRQVIE